MKAELYWVFSSLTLPYLSIDFTAGSHALHPAGHLASDLEVPAATCKQGAETKHLKETAPQANHLILLSTSEFINLSNQVKVIQQVHK